MNVTLALHTNKTEKELECTWSSRNNTVFTMSHGASIIELQATQLCNSKLGQNMHRRSTAMLVRIIMNSHHPSELKCHQSFKQ
jgi:hypothetical protein